MSDEVLRLKRLKRLKRSSLLEPTGSELRIETMKGGAEGGFFLGEN